MGLATGKAEVRRLREGYGKNHLVKSPEAGRSEAVGRIISEATNEGQSETRMDFPLYDRTSDGNCHFLGFAMCQNRLAVPVLSYILETGGFARVIELGTQLGGLTVLLGLQCRMLGLRLDTFDIASVTPYSDWLEMLGVRCHIGDLFSEAISTTVQGLIQAPGRVLLLCDNGDKAREFACFAPFLKPNDVIAAHDYHPTGDYVEKRWAWQEITDTDVESVCAQQHLEPFLQEAATQAAWLFRRKSE